MPIIKSAKKRVRSSERKRKLNVTRRVAYKAALKQARIKTSPDNLSQAFKALDKAAKRRVIHPKKAARLKSRLARSASKQTQTKTAGSAE